MANKFITVFWTVCLTALTATMAGCALQVEYPDAMQTASQDFQITNNRIEILVVFNQDVDINSLEPGVNMILETDNVSNADFTLTAGSNRRSMVLTTTQTIEQLLDFNPDGDFSLELRGSGPNPVRSATGLILDGDNNGRSGGDYQTSFVLIG